MNSPFNPSQYPLGIAILVLWSAFWKALGLYKAIKNDQMWWFVVIFIVNLAGLLEIVYLFRFAKKPMTLDELAFWKLPRKK